MARGYEELVTAICPVCGAFKDGDNQWNSSPGFVAAVKEALAAKRIEQQIPKENCFACLGHPQKMCGFPGRTMIGNLV